MINKEVIKKNKNKLAVMMLISLLSLSLVSCGEAQSEENEIETTIEIVTEDDTSKETSDSDTSEATASDAEAGAIVPAPVTVEGISFDKTAGQMLVSYNRGSQIVLGMVKGYYEGYTEEIHEIFVYDIQ